MSSEKRPRTPPGLAARGRRFWRDTVAEFDLSGAELHLLQEACRTLDDLDRLAGMVEQYGPTVTGSQGQPVVNPALTEARGQRLALHRLVSALALPDDDGQTTPSAVSTAARKAAQARWSRTRGA